MSMKICNFVLEILEIFDFYINIRNFRDAYCPGDLLSLTTETLIFVLNFKLQKQQIK